jgi:hypothetical protein
MPKKSTTKQDVKAEVTAPSTFKLTSICEEQGKNPKAVRARFRKMYRGDNPSKDLPPTVNNDAGRSGWEFAMKYREAVATLVGAVDAKASE